MDVNARFESLETNPALNQVMAPNEPVALITMSADINNNQSFMNMCIPYISVEKYIDKFVIQYRNQSSPTVSSENKKNIESDISDVKVDACVELGTTNIKIKDFINLNIGDCIKLNTKVGETLDLCIEGEPHYKVSPGKIGKKIGAQIVEIYSKDVDNHE
jgi:flagellar motor switch protein FliM